MRSIAIGTITAVVIAASAAIAQSPMREGNWEITMQMQMPNMPMQMPAQKVVRCVTKKDLETPGGELPKGPDEKNSKCTTSNYKRDGNKATWNMACSAPEPMTGSGEIVTEGDSYTGTMKMTSSRGEMTMKYTGKRLGDCPQ